MSREESRKKKKKTNHPLHGPVSAHAFITESRSLLYNEMLNTSVGSIS